MAFAEDGRIFFSTPGGTFWSFDPKTNATTNHGKVPTTGGDIAWGLLGFALDPDFLTNNFVYTYYSANPRNYPEWKATYQLWRYTLSGGKLDLAGGKFMLEFPANKGDGFKEDHGGGGMGFDAQGNLFIATGDNTGWELMSGSIDETRMGYNGMRTAANTNDLRGKIIRIHPEPDGSYTIPSGNLFAPGTDSTKPEIFAMGFRNPFSLHVDKATGTVVWADVGPQEPTFTADKGPAGMEEFNATRTAGFFGWPMFMGPNLAFNNYDYAANKPGVFFDSLVPMNNSKYNTGLKRLPPARSSVVAYGKDGKNNPWTGFERGSAVPITGPIYRYNGKNPSKIKLPPHFDGKWFVADDLQRWIKVIVLDYQSIKAASVAPAFPGITYPSTDQHSIIAMNIGPDGALYYTDYGSQTFRVEYLGSCLPDVTPSPINKFTQAGHSANFRNAFLLAPMGYPRQVAMSEGQSGFSLFEATGRKVWEYRRNGNSGPNSVSVPNGIGSGSILRGLFFE